MGDASDVRDDPGRRPDRTVEVVPYDDAWPARFASIRGALAAAVPEAVSIEHIGSTSVPGLSSKPTIDVLVEVNDLHVVLDRTDALAAAGFDLRPDAFPARRHHLFLRQVRGGRRLAHVHVLLAGSPEADDYRRFRDLLRTDASARDRYEAVKLDLAARFGNDRLRYVTEKESVVEALITERWPDLDRSWRR